MDHHDDATMIEEATPELARAGVSLHSAEARADFLAQYKRAKLELVAKSNLLSEYELVKDDQMPELDTSLAAWLVRNQSKAMASEKMVFIDFRAPIEIEALLISDDIMWVRLNFMKNLLCG